MERETCAFMRVPKPTDFSFDTSEDEDEVEPNKATAEETAFLKSIEKEETDTKKAAEKKGKTN
jgi:hypothetical protein